MAEWMTPCQVYGHGADSRGDFWSCEGEMCFGSGESGLWYAWLDENGGLHVITGHPPGYDVDTGVCYNPDLCK